MTTPLTTEQKHQRLREGAKERRARMRLEAADFERAAAAGEVCLADSIDRRTLASIPKGEIDA